MKLTTYSDAMLEKAAIPADFTLQQTMEVMSHLGLRFVPIVDAEGRLIAAAADGDVRRYIARGGHLGDLIIDAANRTPRVISEKLPVPEIRSLMLRWGIEALPETRNGKLHALHILSVAPDPLELTVVLMAGGLGSRLAPMTDTCPKPLLKMGSKPILTHIIEHLRDQGVRRFIISVNYLAEMLVDHYGDGSSLGVFITYVHETTRMGTGGALSLIDPEALSETFMVFNGDILNDVDIHELRQVHETSGWNATMVVREYSYTIPYGVVRRNGDGRFDGAEEKPTMQYCINAGIYMLSKRVLDLVPRGMFYDLPTLFSDLSGHGLQGGTYSHPGRWIDIGNITDFNRAQSIYESQTE